MKGKKVDTKVISKKERENKMTETETKRKNICKYEIPEVLHMMVGTDGKGFFVHYYDVKKLRESYQICDTGREAINIANEVYDKFKKEATNENSD
tara:strand:- start:2390 stop:2674 length:285 start_codon:yes stop_codon:yes gene_type:complete